MTKRVLPYILFLSLTIACKKQGTEGLNSLVAMQNFSSNTSCPAGGLAVKSGLDKNKNNTLDDTEVTDTKYLCNGQSSTTDKQILFSFNGGSNTTGTTPVFGGQLIKFSKKNYPGVDSIILVANPNVGDPTNTAIIEVFNLTDNVPISNSTITSNNLYSTTYLQSGNLYNSLPDKEVMLTVSIKSGTAGKFASAGNCFLVLYRK